MDSKYGHDCPFEAYITNLGKYNEGELAGEWVKFPTTPEELQKAFERIGIGSKDEFGNVYEEWFITDYDCHVEGIYEVLGEYESLDELNFLASRIDEMDKHDYEKFEAAVAYGDHTGSMKDLINLTDNLDCYDIASDVHSEADLGYYYIQESGIYDLSSMGQLANYIDYEAFGRDVALEESGRFTEHGYITDGRDSFTEYYDGPENFPPEYLVTKLPDDISERLEQTTDLAFDIDVCLCTFNPEYAAMFPDEHARKEAIADKLLEDDTPSIRNELADMAREYDVQSEVTPLMQRLDEYESDYDIHTFSIYQLKPGEETRDLRFQPLDQLQSAGLDVSKENYNLIYSDHYSSNITLDSIYQRFNIDYPEDFKGHSLSVSDVIVIRENGMDTAHYCDSFGFAEIPEFLQPENHLKNAEMAMEDDYGMIDGIINNGKKEVTPPGTEEKPSIRERLAEAKRECSEHKPPEVKKPEKNEPEHGL